MVSDEKKKENPKSETRNSKQIPITQIQITETEIAASGGKMLLF